MNEDQWRGRVNAVITCMIGIIFLVMSLDFNGYFIGNVLMVSGFAFAFYLPFYLIMEKKYDA